MKQINRRRFLQSTVLTTAATTLMPLPRSWAQVVGANDTIRVAVVGFGGAGGNHIDRKSGV